MTFDNLRLIEPLRKALATEGYTTPTPIQQQAIPLILERKDLLGVAQTGTGKTAAFSLPMLQLLHNEIGPARGPRPIRTLILTPTRELAIQIDESIAAYGSNLGLRHAVIFGGVGQKPQTDALRAGIDILVATPGRLLDLMNQGFVILKNVSFFVLDEADRMLDMGFIHDVKKVIAKLPAQRQSLFFSATMPPEVAKLANTILTNPVRVEVTPQASTADTVQQTLYYVDQADKKNLLIYLLQDKSIVSALVFSRTKHGSDKVVKELLKAGLTAEAIHGNKSQNARQRALSNFKNGQTRVLVATDIAARGIDIDDLTHVINYELPNIPETYVHRIGRTGRAGASGMALSFCDAEEKEYLRDIQKLIGKPIPVVTDHPYPLQPGAASAAKPQSEDRRHQGGRNGRSPGNRSGQNEPRRESQRNSQPRAQQPAAARSGEGRPAQQPSASPQRAAQRENPPSQRQADKRPAGGPKRPQEPRPNRERLLDSINSRDPFSY